MPSTVSSVKHKKKSAPVKKQPSVFPTESPRHLRAARQRWYQPKTWRAAYPKHGPLPKARLIFRSAFIQLRSAKKAVVGVTVVYGMATLVLVHGFSSNQDIASIKSLVGSMFTGSLASEKSLLLQLTLLFGGTGSSSASGGSSYQTVVLIVCSLAMIWVLRQNQAKKTVSTKLAFYQGMYPLIPLLGVILIIGVQLIPFVVGTYLYSNLIGGGIAVHFVEKLVAVAVFLGLAYWSLRMITSSLFALYIVTLPGMTPMEATRSAKRLVLGRRLLIWRKLLFLPLLIIIGSSLIILPFLIFLAPIAVWVFFILTIMWFTVIHGFLYTLYRELLND